LLCAKAANDPALFRRGFGRTCGIALVRLRNEARNENVPGHRVIASWLAFSIAQAWSYLSDFSGRRTLPAGTNRDVGRKGADHVLVTIERFGSELVKP
jgi:hypothetical protein